MIDWEDVVLKAGYPTEKAMWEDLYITQGLGLRTLQIRFATSAATLRMRMASQGVRIRPRGGANNTISLLSEDQISALEKEGIRRAARRLHLSYNTLRRTILLSKTRK